MEIFSDIFFLSIFLTSYIFRNDGGIPLPFQETCDENELCWKRLPIWDFLIGDGTPETLTDILLKNFLLWGFFYSIFHILTHIKPQRKLFHPFKFNPNYPPLSLVIKEIVRSGRGILIASVYEYFVTPEKQFGWKIGVKIRHNQVLIRASKMTVIKGPLRIQHTYF